MAIAREEVGIACTCRTCSSTAAMHAWQMTPAIEVHGSTCTEVAAVQALAPSAYGSTCAILHHAAAAVAYIAIACMQYR